jgi:DNA-binding CsgD family transcriptional regulator
MDQQLLDRIYECSFVPEQWPGVLQELATMIEAQGGSLFVLNRDVTHWTASLGQKERMERVVASGALWQGTFAARLFALRHAGFMIETDGFTLEELSREPLYRDVFWPAGYGWCACALFGAPTGERIVLSLNRLYERGVVERAFLDQLDTLRPHLARAVLMSGRLQLERARAAAETLASLGLPALVLGDDGKVLAANHLIEALTGFVHWRAHGRVALKDKAADKLLRDAAATIDLANGTCVRSFPVRDGEANAAMVAHVVPVRLSARDIFVHCAVVLVMTPVTLPHAPPVELVQSLFDLTPTEARVARSLASGKTVDDIAADRGVSPNTIRTHVRGVLEKTGCARQAQVVALLAGISADRSNTNGFKV